MSEYRTKQSELIKQARELHNQAEAAERDLTAEENEKFDSLMADADKYGEQAAKLEKLEKAEEYMSESAGRISKPQHIELPKETKQRYSLLRALNLKAEGKPLDGLELEVSQEIARQTGKDPEGFYAPLTCNLETYDTDTTTGAGTIGTVIADNDFVKTLRNRLVIESMGARIMTGLTGNFAIPVQSASASGSWVGEGAAASESSVEADAASQVAMSSKTLTVNAEYTKKFMRQTSIDAEKFVVDDLIAALALSIDAGALNGDGTGSNPLGILQNSGVTLVEMDDTNGAVPTWAKIVEMETGVANSNADFGSLGYVTNSKVRGKLKTTEKASSTAQFIYESGEFPVNGYRCGVTNNMPSNATKGSGTALSSMIFGNFNDLVVGLWGGLDLVVDPYSKSKNGMVVITLSQECDIALRRAASFSRCTDIVTS